MKSLFALLVLGGIAQADVKPPGTILEDYCGVVVKDVTTVCLATKTGTNTQYLTVETKGVPKVTAEVQSLAFVGGVVTLTATEKLAPEISRLPHVFKLGMTPGVTKYRGKAYASWDGLWYVDGKMIGRSFPMEAQIHTATN